VYKCWFGVEPEGLAVAWRLTRRSGSELVYYSLELLLEENMLSLMHRIKKRVERRASQAARLTITQDRARAKLLCESNQIPPDRIVLLPVGARGDPIVTKTDYLRRKFRLDPDIKIVLYAGTIADWSCSLELAQAALTWPENWRLVLHGNILTTSENADYIQGMLSIAQDRRIILSTDWVPLGRLDELVASADVGVALYFEADRNRRFIASSSGKIAQYLKCGLPVVVSDFPRARVMFEDTGCGIAVHDAAELAEAVATILTDYDVYRSNAMRRYVEYYRIDRSIMDVLRRLDL
jgi:glycosyltransferase involved in cell wall biosynthesis